MKILVVDDEPAIVAAVVYNLRQQKYEPVTAADADEALRLFRAERPDLVILDVMLPSGSGFDICRIIRETSRVPILMLTARVSESDRVQGLELGADDYLIKPFGMRELMARVKALLRRSAESAHEEGPAPVLTSALRLDAARREAWLHGKPISLSRREFDLLFLLASHAGTVFDRQTLLDRVWGEESFVDDRTVDVHVRWLREKIEANPRSPEMLLTVRGVGYKVRGD